MYPLFPKDHSTHIRMLGNNKFFLKLLKVVETLKSFQMCSTLFLKHCKKFKLTPPL